MQGLEFSREFYRQYGRPMLEEAFADVRDRIAVGVAGEGSECLGFDDEHSRDHDFDIGFCLWLTREDEEAFGFRLARAYAKLPREFMGITRPALSPVGGNRRGVMTIEDFYTRFLGAPNAPDSTARWLYTPPHALRAATSGEVFADPLGAFSAVRDTLLLGYPADIRRKKLAAHTVLMAQSGQYNYPRCLARGESGAAQLAVFEFVRHTISVIYLLNGAYEPFYKWAYRGLRTLPILGNIEDLLTGLTELGNTPAMGATKEEVIEDIAALVANALRAEGLSHAGGNALEGHAYAIQNGIADAALRNMHIMEGI